MKNYIIILLTMVVLTMSSCGEDFLSPAPVSSIGSATYYTTEGELETGVINMYDGIQGINSTRTGDYHAIQVEYQLTEMRSDNTRTKNSEGEAAQFEQFAVQSTNGVVADYYNSYYNIIFRANVVLANLGVASDAKAAQFEGEAKFVRAYAYFNLVRLFGEIPLATDILSATDNETSFTRRSVDDVYDLIVSDLVAAEANLNFNGYKTRATKAGAQTLLAKVYLTTGNYAGARTMCENVMASGYALEPNFRDIFYNELNDEVIFAVEFISDNANDSQNFSAEWLNAVGRSSGLNYVTNEALAAFASFGGQERSDYSWRPDAAQADQYQVVKYLPNGDDNLGIQATSSDPTLAGNDWIVLRYADVLLMHAEAILGTDPISTNAAAIASMQAVRDRAGLTTPLTSVFKQELLDERRVELAFENHRLFDLIRFGVAESVLGQFATDNGFLFSATDLLLPIPQREIGLSKGLMAQNPGY